MKILLIGASSDIACHLYETYKTDYDFIRLSSNDEFSDISNFNLQDPWFIVYSRHYKIVFLFF